MQANSRKQRSPPPSIAYGRRATHNPPPETMNRALRFTQQRQFVSSLFGFTFLAAVLTVSASNILPCPAIVHKGRHADAAGDAEGPATHPVTVAKRPRRWIEEVRPVPTPK
ncbi:hypothetical protein B0H15DRAFT_946655 [Mycena belliarum]|uniref:Transmembrane protein n=1 Tax=Mycena belliarum TaxID=1033014 RepID=A0AAD6U8L6_9AGAR|nr:hypothetical protein B0H15DRAFT_946655 [Mycena belliae]